MEKFIPTVLVFNLPFSYSVLVAEISLRSRTSSTGFANRALLFTLMRIDIIK